MNLTTPLDDILGSRSHTRILRALVHARGLELSARSLAARAGITHPTAARVLRDLDDSGLLHVRMFPKLSTYTLTADHVAIPLITSLFAWEERLKQEFLSALSSAFADRSGDILRGYVFGSAAWGTMRPDSDIDVALICRRGSSRRVDDIVPAVAEAIRERFGQHLDVHLSESSTGKERSVRTRHPLWRRVIDEGILFLSHDEAASNDRRPPQGITRVSHQG